MITRAEFRNFKCLRKLDVDLERLTVLVGPNGCGKTSVLQGIHLISQIAVPQEGEAGHVNNRLGVIFSGSRDPQRLVSPGAPSFDITLQERMHQIALHVVPRLQGHGFRVEVGRENPSRLSLSYKKANNEVEPTRFLNSPAVWQFRSMVQLNLSSTALAESSVTDQEVPRLAQDGTGLASVLAYLAGAAPELKAAIETDLRKVVPQVISIRTFPAKVRRLGKRKFPIGDQTIDVPEQQEVWGHRFALEMLGGGIVPADLLSEGTVLSLGLLTLLHSPDAPRVVLLDDIDKGLHMGAQFRLIEAIRRVLEARPETQIIGTSHSPFLVDALDPSEVRVMRLDEQGHAHCRPLTDSPDFARWRKGLQPGELWATLGEDWVDGSNAG